MKIKIIYITIILLLLQKKVADQEITPSLEYALSPLRYAHQYPIYYTFPVLVLLEDEFFYKVLGVVKPLSPVERMQDAIQA